VSNGIVTIVGGPRADNAIGYEAPKMGPVSIYAMVALAESATSNQHGNFYGFNVRYSDGPVGVGVTVGHQAKAEDNGAAASSLLLGASYDFGAAKLMGGVQYVKNTTRAANLDDDREEAFLGVQVPMGAGSLWAGAGTGRFKDISGTRATQASVGYLHNLDKSTTLYVIGTTVSNGAVGTLSDGQGNFFAASTDTATGGGPAVSQGRDAHQIVVGARYAF
jgi:predicted porin